MDETPDWSAHDLEREDLTDELREAGIDDWELVQVIDRTDRLGDHFDATRSDMPATALAFTFTGYTLTLRWFLRHEGEPVPTFMTFTFDSVAGTFNFADDADEGFHAVGPFTDANRIGAWLYGRREQQLVDDTPPEPDGQ